MKHVLRHALHAAALAVFALAGPAPKAGEAVAAPGAASLQERFAECPTAGLALQLARLTIREPEAIHTAFMLGEPAPALLAWALCRYPSPSARTDLEELLGSADQVAGYWAAKALGALADPASLDALAAQFPPEDKAFWEVSDGPPNGRGRMYYFRYVRAKNGQSVRQAVRAPDDMPNIRVAYAALEALGRIGGPQATDVLLRELGRDHYLIRYGAVHALARLRHAPAAAELTRLAESDPVLIVRQAAREALRWIDGSARPEAPTAPKLPPSIIFVKTRERTESNLGYRDSYPYPRLPWYAWGQNLYSLTPPQPDGILRNLTNLENGGVQGPEISYDATRVLFAMRKDFASEGFHIYEMNTDGSDLRQLTSGNCNDVDPQYLPDGRILFCSDRAGTREFYHQERSRVLYRMDADGGNIEQISFNPNADFEPVLCPDGRVLFGSYRFYGWDGGPTAVLQDPRKGISRIETVLHTVLPDGSDEQVFYGSMRGGFFSTLRPMPYANQFQTTAWPRTDQMLGMSVSFQRYLPDGRLVCVTPAGLAVVDPSMNPMDCETPLYPEVLNLAGGEEVYIHSFDDQNPVGRYTAPYPVGGDWVLVSHAPWYDRRVNGYGLYLLNLKTRDMQLVYDDPQMSDVDAAAVVPRAPEPVLPSMRDPGNRETGFVFCQSVFNSDLPFDRAKIASVRVMEALQVGLSMNGNLGFQTRILGTVPIARDGSFHVEVPADTPFRFALLDLNGNTVVHETDFMYVRPGERKGCVGCHESKGSVSLNTKSDALRRPPYRALRKRGDLVYGGRFSRPYNYVVRE